MIGYELSDPRVASAIVTEVLVSPDGKRAQVRLKVEGSREEQEATLATLDHARGFLRRELGQRLTIFRVPDLHFELDVDPGLDARLKSVLKRIKKGRPKVEPETGPRPVDDRLE